MAPGFTLKTPWFHRYIYRAGQLLLILASTYFVLFFLYLVLANYWPGPYEDYWADMPLIESFFQGSATFDQLIIAHNNSHRVLIPRLLFIADYQYASGSNTLLIGIACVFKLGLVYFFNRQITTQTLTSRLLLNAIIAMAVFNGAIVYNTVFNINMQWDMMLLFSFLSIFYYHQYYSSETNKNRSLILAYILFVCAALSHAGGYFCLPVFCLININRKKYLVALLPVCLFIIIFYLQFFVLPVSHTDGNSYQHIVMTQFTDLPTEFLHFFRLLSIGIYKNFPGLSVYFSLYILMLASLNAILHKNLTPKENNIWIYLAVFMAMVIFITSAARSGRDWHADAAEPRFKVLSIFLILILTIHGLLLSRHIIHRLRAKIIGSLIIINSVALMLLAHHSYYPTSFHLSNKTLSTHTDILMKGADRITGRWLGRGILFRTEQDPLAHMDPFFKANGYAYYDNKVIRSGTALQAIKPGDQLVNPNELDIFSKTCRINQSPLETYSDGEIPVIFSTAIDPETQNNLLSSLHRNSYFTLDTSGVVIGYAYIFIDQNNYNIQTYLRGLSNSPDIQYIAEISHNQAKCLYQISPVKP